MGRKAGVWLGVSSGALSVCVLLAYAGTVVSEENTQ